MSIWLDETLRVIAQVRAKYPDTQGIELKQLLSKAYPFGKRKHYPYKVWLREVNKVCGTQQMSLTEWSKLQRWNDNARQFKKEKRR